ncbi:MAG TPA: hypothetical protein VNS88_13590, partial [Nitrospiraceae bacterium]|nr:hypothetical protein [Nitrospiraceae bacterium]
QRHFGSHPKPRQFGGMLHAGTTGIVGEAGPELAHVTRGGAMITPLGQGMPGNIGVPSLENVLSLNLATSVQIDKREIARAYNTELARVTGQRGGRPPQTQIW